MICASGYSRSSTPCEVTGAPGVMNASSRASRRKSTSRPKREEAPQSAGAGGWATGVGGVAAEPMILASSAATGSIRSVSSGVATTSSSSRWPASTRLISSSSWETSYLPIREATSPSAV